MTRLGHLVCATAAAAALAVLLSMAAQAATVEPNDPYWRQSWSEFVLRMPEVWQRTTGSPNVVIATVDTGVDPSVQDLEGQLVPGWDFIQNDAVPRDTVGHGTHVASVIAARGNNGIGIAGYCWGCRIMPVRITSDGSATGPQIARGVYWAVDHGARIITIGLNSSQFDFDAASAMRYARERGVLVIASAGNTGTEALRYPAADAGVLPIAATNDSDVLYFWSTHGSWVPLAAPGCQLVIDPGVGPGTLCGTSFTPAVVAGVAGLMLSLKPSLTADEIIAALTSTAVPVAGIGGGRINPVAALQAVAPEAPQPEVPGTGAPGSEGTVAGVQPSSLVVVTTRQIDLRTGIMRARLRRTVRVGAGRLDVQLHASRAAECQISLVTPTGDFVLSLLPPGEPNLLSMSQTVRRAGRYRVDISCDPIRRRSYTLSITGMPVPVPVVKAP